MSTLPAADTAPRVCDHTQPFQFAEWNYSFGRRWNPDADDLFRYKQYARSANSVKGKWAYVYRSVNSRMTLHRELWIDDKKQIRLTPPNQTLASPRVDTQSRSVEPEFNLDFFSEEGHPVELYYVIYSRVRLPLGALLALADAEVERKGRFVNAIRALLRPCFRWTKSPHVGIYKHETCEENPAHRPIEKFVRVGGRRSVVGYDLVQIAARLGNEYREALREFQVRYVRPEDREHMKEFDRESLANAVYSLVNDSDELKERVEDVLRWDELQAYREERRDDRMKRLKKYERAAARVCKVLDNPLYEIIRDGLRFDEDAPGEENVYGAKYFTHLYAATLLELNVSAAGATYTHRQMADFRLGKASPNKAWGGSGKHYLADYVFRDSPSPEKIFKTTRMVTKSVLSLFSSFVGEYIAQRRTATYSDIAGHLEHILREGTNFTWGNTYYANVAGCKFKAKDIEYRTWVRNASGDFEWLTETIYLIEPEDVKKMEAFEKAAMDADSILAHNKVVPILLDAINLCLAINALHKKTDGNVTDWGREALDASAHFLNLSKTVLEHTCSDVLSKRTLQRLPVISVITASYSVVADLYDASKASDVHDYDRAYALVGAAVGEAMAMVGVLIVLKTTAAGAAAGPVGVILGIIGGLVATVGYLIASWGKDTPIETFIKHCEWGTYAYQSETTKIEAWHTPHSIADWKDHPKRQLNALQRLVGQFSVTAHKPDVNSAILDSQNHAAKVRFTQLFDDTRVVVRCNGTLRNDAGQLHVLGDVHENIESEELIRRTRRSSERGAPELGIGYPKKVRDSVRKYYDKGYRIESLSISVEVQLRDKQSIGTAGISVYRDGDLRDPRPGISTAGSFDPHVG